MIKTKIAPAIVSATLACAIFTGSGNARAALMAYEGFNYSTGSGNLTGLDGGFGWNGSWQGVVNGSSSVQSVSLVAGANAPSGYDSHSAGNSAFTPNGTRTGRFLDTSAGGVFGTKGFIDGNGNIGAAGKTIYLSFMQQPNIANNNYYEFEFHRGNLNDPGRVGGVGCDTSGSSNVYLRTPSATQTLIGPASTSVSFYVVRVDFMGGNDTVTVYQNPTSATEAGATPSLVETGAGDMSFNGISFGAFVNGATVAHDEVRFGETWGDVISPTAASTGQWVGGGANNNWSTGGNWDNGAVPVFATSLTFAGNTRLNNTNDLTGVSANNITFDSAAGAFTLNGNSLGINGNILFNGNPSSLVTQTINLPLTPGSELVVDTRPNGNITINGNITGAGTEITQTDSQGNVGVVTLAGTNSIKGLVINNGTNHITGTTAVNGIGGSSFFYLADSQTTRTATLIIDGSANFSVNGSFQDAGVIGRNGGIATIVQNGGTFSFNMSGSPSYLFVGASGNSNTRAEYDMNGGLLDMNGQTLGVALGANTLVTGVVSQASGVITNVGNLYFSPLFAQGHGIYNLTGGTIYIGSGGITVFSGGGYELNLGGGNIGALASWSSVLNMNLTGVNGPTTFNPAGNVITLSGIISGTGGLTANGAGILELSGANTYTGDTIVSSGSTLQIDNTGSRAGAIKLATGSTLNLNFTGNYAVSALYLNGVLQPAGIYNSTTSPSFITGSGNLVVSSISSGLWTGLGANNNWSAGGNWDNNVSPIFPHAVTFAGNNRLNNNNDFSSITISGLTFSNNAGAFTIGGNDVTLSGGINFNGNPAAPVTETINLGMTFTGNQTFNLPANGNLTLGGSITSGNAITKGGLGTLTLGGASDGFSSFFVDGGTNVITGNVAVTGNGGDRFYVGDIGTTGALVIQPGGSLNISGGFADAGVIGRDSGIGTVIQNGGSFIFNMANQGNFFVGASSSATTRAEYDMNGGTLDLNNNTFAIALSANSATLITGVVSQVSGVINNVGKLDLGAFTFGPGRGIYRMTGGGIYIGANGIQTDSGVYEIYLGGGTVGAYSSWSSPLNMNLTGINGPVTFDTAGNTINLTGILSGAGGFNIIGGGVLELSGANTFVGDMTVTAGTLQLDATGSSPGVLRVATGATLNLNYSGNYIVGGFTTNGVQVNNGTYNAGNLPGFISGSGNLLVQTVSLGIWDGGGADNNWSSAANWDHNVLPIFPIGLTFGGSTRLNNNNDLSGANVTSITFSNSAGAFLLNGNGISLSGNIGFNGNPAAPITQTINLPVSLTANVNVDAPANGTIAIAGDISAPNNALLKIDTGALTLGGNDNLAAFEADGGTATITGTTTVTGTGGSRAYVANGDYVGGSVGTLVISNSATFNITGNFADAYVIGRDTGVGRLIQNGGTFTFNPGNQTWIFVGAGNNPSTRGEYDMNGGLLDMNGKNLGLGLGVGVAVTGVVNQVSGVITNVGQLFLNPNNGGYGFYNLTGGSLYLGSGGIAYNSGGGYQLNFGGGTISAEASWSSSLNINLTGVNGATTFNPAGNTITLSGALSGTGGLTVSGGGVLELSGANTYTGDTTVNAGSALRLDAAGTTTGTFRVASGGGLNLNYVGTYTVGRLFTNGVALVNGIYNSANLPAFISGAGSIQVVDNSTTPPPISFSISGGNLNLSWGTSGFTLQQQINSLGVGLSTNWVNVPGSASVTNLTIPINPSTPAAFYRLH